MQRIVLGTALLAAAGTGAATLESCSPDTCTLEARPSVRVEVFDMNGRPLPADSVWYRPAAGPDELAPIAAQQGRCIDDNCTEWIAGREVEGDMEVYVSACGETKARSVTVPMTADDCHVDTQTLELGFDCGLPPLEDPTADTGGPELTPAPKPPVVGCAKPSEPSVEVTVVEEDTGALLPASNVSYVYSPADPSELEPGNETDLELPPIVGQGVCSSDLCDVWEVGTDQAGYFDIWAHACGNTSPRADVFVPEDGCNIEPQSVTLAVECTEEI